MYYKFTKKKTFGELTSKVQVTCTSTSKSNFTDLLLTFKYLGYLFICTFF